MPDKEGPRKSIVDIMVAGYLARCNYVCSYKCLTEESPDLRSQIHSANGSIMFDDMLHGKRLDEIIIMYNECRGFFLSSAFLEFGSKLRDLVNEYTAMTNPDVHYSSAQKVLYGKRVPPSNQSRAVDREHQNKALDVLSTSDTVSSDHVFSNFSSSARRKCTQPVSTKTRLVDKFKQAAQQAIECRAVAETTPLPCSNTVSQSEASIENLDGSFASYFNEMVEFDLINYLEPTTSKSDQDLEGVVLQNHDSTLQEDPLQESEEGSDFQMNLVDIPQHNEDRRSFVAGASCHESAGHIFKNGPAVSRDKEVEAFKNGPAVSREKEVEAFKNGPAVSRDKGVSAKVSASFEAGSKEKKRAEDMAKKKKKKEHGDVSGTKQKECDLASRKEQHAEVKTTAPSNLTAGFLPSEGDNRKKSYNQILSVEDLFDDHEAELEHVSASHSDLKPNNTNDRAEKDFCEDAVASNFSYDSFDYPTSNNSGECKLSDEEISMEFFEERLRSDHKSFDLDTEFESSIPLSNKIYGKDSRAVETKKEQKAGGKLGKTEDNLCKSEEPSRKTEEMSRETEETSEKLGKKLGEAEDSMTKAEETSRKAVEALGRVEEISRNAEEMSRKAEETSRKGEEAFRRAEETSRKAEEKPRKTAEKLRTAEEKPRKVEETSRKAEETSRRTEETSWKIEETLRKADETLHRSEGTSHKTQGTSVRTEETLRKTEGWIKLVSNKKDISEASAEIEENERSPKEKQRSVKQKKVVFEDNKSDEPIKKKSSEDTKRTVLHSEGSCDRYLDSSFSSDESLICEDAVGTEKSNDDFDIGVFDVTEEGSERFVFPEKKEAVVGETNSSRVLEEGELLPSPLKSIVKPDGLPKEESKVVEKKESKNAKAEEDKGSHSVEVNSKDKKRKEKEMKFRKEREEVEKLRKRQMEDEDRRAACRELKRKKELEREAREKEEREKRRKDKFGRSDDKRKLEREIDKKKHKESSYSADNPLKDKPEASDLRGRTREKASRYNSKSDTSLEEILFGVEKTSQKQRDARSKESADFRSVSRKPLPSRGKQPNIAPRKDDYKSKSDRDTKSVRGDQFTNPRKPKNDSAVPKRQELSIDSLFETMTAPPGCSKKEEPIVVEQTKKNYDFLKRVMATVEEKTGPERVKKEKVVSSGVEKGRPNLLAKGGHSARGLPGSGRVNVGMVLEMATSNRRKRKYDATSNAGPSLAANSQVTTEAKGSTASKCVSGQSLSSSSTEKDMGHRKRILDLPLPKTFSVDLVGDILKETSYKETQVDRLKRYSAKRVLGDKLEKSPITSSAESSHASSLASASPRSYSSPDISIPNEENPLFQQPLKRARLEDSAIDSVLNSIYGSSGDE